MMKITTYRGIDISVREDGLFYAERDGARFVAATLAEAKLGIDRSQRAKKIRVSVPFFCPQRMKQGRVTGRHATRNSFLVQWSDGEREELTTLYGMLRTLGVDEAEELRKLTEEKARADRAYQKFIASYRKSSLAFEVDAEIKQRHKQAEETGVEPEETTK